MSDFRQDLRESAKELARLGMFILTVKYEADGTPGKKSFDKWSADQFPGPTTPDTIEFDISWSNRCGIWVRIPDEWVVIDPDSDEAMDYWRDRLGHAMSKAAISKPPNGRPHWWFRIPRNDSAIYNWSAPSNNDHNLKFDVRGQRRGGVMAPPSEHHKGGNRAWIRGLDQVETLTADEAALLARHTLPGAKADNGKAKTPLGEPRPPKYNNGQGTKYGLAALRSELKAMTEARDANGTFNNQVNRSCYSLGQLVSGGELAHEHTYDAITNLLDQFNSDSDHYRTRDSGYFDGFDRPRSGSVSIDGEEFFGELNGKPNQFLVATLAEAIVKEGPIGVGLNGHLWTYKEGVWKPDRHAVRNRAAELLDELYRNNHAADVESVIRARSKIIECEPQPRWINFRNGLLDWQTGHLHPHTPDVVSTVQLHTEWDESAECPEFEKFLASVVPPDMVDMVWELIGYLMYSGNPLHKAVMLHGSGRNGKGTWIRMIKTLLGAENCTAVTLQALTMERFAAASLFGKIANIAGDIDGTYLEQTAKLKAITGEDVITAEFKNKDPFDFTPWAVPVFSANKIPGSSDVTQGYMSRWVVVPFPHDFTGREDRTLDARLHTPQEIRGIAAKAVPALRRLMERGNFEEPESAKEAMKEFKKRTNQVETWLDEACDVGPHHADTWTYRTDLYDAYKRWAQHGGYGVLKAAEFYDRVRNAGMQETKVKGKYGFKGFKVVEDRLGEALDSWKRSKDASRN